MQVETFEQLESTTDETGATTMECDSEAIALIEELGLSGQQKLLERRESDDGTTTRRCPYRKMTAGESAIYRCLCPAREKIADYDSGPIPTRVLQVAAHAKGFFECLEVWSASDPAIKDPVLVGVTKDGWQEVPWILARWGDCLEPLESLTTKALERTRKIKRAAAQKIAAEAARFLATVGIREDEKFMADDAPVAYHLD